MDEGREVESISTTPLNEDKSSGANPNSTNCMETSARSDLDKRHFPNLGISGEKIGEKSSVNPSTDPAAFGKSKVSVSSAGNGSENATQNTSEQSLSSAREDLLRSLNLNAKTETESCAMDTEMPEDAAAELNTTLLASLELEKGNFFKGCKWAPDGLCLMTCSEDNIIRLINTPSEVLSEKWDFCKKTIQMESCLKLREAEIIYDYTWWPHMNSAYPETCCLATTAKDQPVHLWDAFNGDLRASYIPKNNVDEVTAAHCIAFSPDGLQMICGFAKDLRLFYVDRPGDYCEKWPTRKHKRATGQRGIISTSEFSPDGSTIACGSYDGTVGLYSLKNGELTGLFDSKTSGITLLKYSSDGKRLYSGSRKDNSIICWDVRYLSGDLFHLERKVETNQRIYFDLISKTTEKTDSDNKIFLASGGTDGMVSLWDMTQLVCDATDGQNDTAPCLKFKSHRDCVNGVHFHPFLPILATSSGQRHFCDFSDSEEDSDAEILDFEENSLKLWHITGLPN